MNTHYITSEDFLDFLKELTKEHRTFYLKGDSTQFNWKQNQRKLLYWQEYKDNFEGMVSGSVRAQDPLKQFIFSSKEKVSEDFRDLQNKEQRPLLLIGAKNCDLSGLDITDFVFMQGDFKDPFYINKRNSMFIIASDCSNPIDTCFCLALGSQPFPEKNYDISISQQGDGYLLETASAKAQAYITRYKNYFKPAMDSQLKERAESRKNTVKEVEKNISKYQIPNKDMLSGVVDKCFESQIWQDEIKTCVECGCCNVICPTCHCFFLSDSNKNTRYKVWDACLYKDFAVVAGGANPRKRLFQRLRNRYEKKFSFFPNIIGKFACTGCGRCITGCPAKIDIRRILKNLVSEASKV